MTVDPCLHLSRRVVCFEQLDDARIGLNGSKDVVELEFFRLRLFAYRRLAEPIDDGGDIRLLEQFTDRGELKVRLRLFEISEVKGLARSEFVKAKPDGPERDAARS